MPVFQDAFQIFLSASPSDASDGDIKGEGVGLTRTSTSKTSAASWSFHLPPGFAEGSDDETNFSLGNDGWGVSQVRVSGFLATADMPPENPPVVQYSSLPRWFPC
jgi:hypothetical protein